MMDCPRCSETLIWQNDWDSDDMDDPAIYSQWICPTCQTDVTFKDSVEEVTEDD